MQIFMHELECKHYQSYKRLNFAQQCIVKGVCEEFLATLDERRDFLERVYGLPRMNNYQQLYEYEQDNQPGPYHAHYEHEQRG